MSSLMINDPYSHDRENCEHDSHTYLYYVIAFKESTEKGIEIY